MDPLFSNLAYKYVALVLMLTEASFFAERLNLPLTRPLHVLHVKAGSHVGLPKIAPFSGSLFIGSFFFGFSDGHLRFVEDKSFFPQDIPLPIYLRALSAKQSVIDTNVAYCTATNWLTQVGISVPTLEAQFLPRVRQRMFVGQSHGTFGSVQTSTNALPIFDVEWTRPSRQNDKHGMGSLPIVSVAIYGPKRQLIYLRLDGDITFSSRPKLEIRDVDALLDVSDREFVEMSPVERTNLVMRFSGHEAAGQLVPERRD